MNLNKSSVHAYVLGTQSSYIILLQTDRNQVRQVTMLSTGIGTSDGSSHDLTIIKENITVCSFSVQGTPK